MDMTRLQAANATDLRSEACSRTNRLSRSSSSCFHQVTTNKPRLHAGYPPPAALTCPASPVMARATGNGFLTATCLPAGHPQFATQMARSMTTVLMCTLLVSTVLLIDLPVSMGSSEDDLADLQSESLGQYQQEEAQEIQFNMEMQKLQAEGKMADKASGAQVGSRRLAR